MKPPTLKLKFCTGCGDPILRAVEYESYPMDYCVPCRAENARRYHKERNGHENHFSDAGGFEANMGGRNSALGDVQTDFGDGQGGSGEMAGGFSE